MHLRDAGPEVVGVLEGSAVDRSPERNGLVVFVLVACQVEVLGDVDVLDPLARVVVVDVQPAPDIDITDRGVVDGEVPSDGLGVRVRSPLRRLVGDGVAVVRDHPLKGVVVASG